MHYICLIYFGTTKMFKAVFGSRKIFSENAIFRKEKCIQAVWLPQNSFYEKSIPMFGSFKHFYRKCFI